MRILVGLGNPGKKYQGTRHNVGFEVADALAAHLQVARREKFQGEWWEGRVGGEPLAILKPLTFMNRSGSSVRAACDFFRLTPDRLLVVCDDFHLPVGRLRFRRSGSAGGQKGLSDILTQLGTEAVPRLRIGIGPCPEDWDPADFVLGKFRVDERQRIDPVLLRAACAVEDWIRHGVEYCMNQYNAESS